MIELTKIAREQLDTYFADKEPTPLRLYLAGRCGGPQLALSADPQQEHDILFTLGAYTFLIDADLMQEARHITIDFNYYTGFKFTSDLDAQSGCGTCKACG